MVNISNICVGANVIYDNKINLDLLTLAHENFYFNTLDLEKVQGKSLGCINSRGGGDLPHILYTHATGSHRRGMKEPHATREPRVADPCPRTKIVPSPYLFF